MIVFKNSKKMLSRQLATTCAFECVKASTEFISIRDRIIISNGERLQLIVGFPFYEEATEAFERILQYLQSDDKSVLIDNDLEDED
jgi:hypothetical protein